MQTRETKLDELLQKYSHPSVALFRALELKAIHECVKNIEFAKPSLDLGCGNGVISELLFSREISHGLDNGEAGDVMQAKKNNIYEKVIISDARKMPFPDSEFEFIFSNSVLEHIKDLDKVLGEVSRVLRPGGHFIFTVPSENFSKYLYLPQVFFRYRIPVFGEIYAYLRSRKLHHFHCFSKEEWARKLEHFGITIEASRYYISKACLALWDKMALQIQIQGIATGKAEKKILDKYCSEIKKIYAAEAGQDMPSGAALVIHARKSKK